MISFLLRFRPRRSGPYGTTHEAAQDGSASVRSSERPKASACGKRPWQLDRPGGGFIRAGEKARRGGTRGRRKIHQEQPDPTQGRPCRERESSGKRQAASAAGRKTKRGCASVDVRQVDGLNVRRQVGGLTSLCGHCTSGREGTQVRCPALSRAGGYTGRRNPPSHQACFGQCTPIIAHASNHATDESGSSQDLLQHG